MSHSLSDNFWNSLSVNFFCLFSLCRSLLLCDIGFFSRLQRVNEACRIWMNRVTNKRVVSHMDGTCHIWVSHVTCEWDMSRIYGARDVRMSLVTYEWVVSHMNGRVTHEWVMPHLNGSCHTWMDHNTDVCTMAHMNGTCLLWVERSMSHVSESCHTWHGHVTYEYSNPSRNELCHT